MFNDEFVESSGASACIFFVKCSHYAGGRYSILMGCSRFLNNALGAHRAVPYAPRIELNRPLSREFTSGRMIRSFETLVFSAGRS